MRRETETDSASPFSYSVLVSDAIAAIDAKTAIEPALLNDIMRDRQLYHLIRQKRPDFHVADLSDYIVLQKSASGEPTKILEWDMKSGELVVLKKKWDDVEKQWMDSGCEVISPLNCRNFELVQDDEGRLYVRETIGHGYYEAKDYIDRINVSHNNRALALQGLDLLARVREVPRGLEVYLDGDYLTIPEKRAIYYGNDQVQEMVKDFRVTHDIAALETMDRQIWSALTPKQRADYVACVGIPLLNIIIETAALDILKPFIEIYGHTGTGKTWLVKLALRLWWGMMNRSSLLVGTTISGSLYRYHTSMDATNLPVFVDEVGSISNAVIDSMKAGAMGAGTYRGTGDVGRNKKYRARATIICTAQDDIFARAGSLADELALGRRLYKQEYDSEDKDSMKDVAAHDNLLYSIKDGGLLYARLEKIPFALLVKNVLDWYALTGDSVRTGLILGLWVTGHLNKEDMDSMTIEYRSDDLLIRNYALLLKDYEQSAGSDAKAMELRTMLKGENGDILVTSAYIDWVNAQKSHPLCGIFHNLGGLKPLASLFIGWSPDKIYNTKMVGRINGKPARYARLPASMREGVTKCNASVTEYLNIIIDNKIDNSYTTTLVTPKLSPIGIGIPNPIGPPLKPQSVTDPPGVPLRRQNAVTELQEPFLEPPKRINENIEMPTTLLQTTSQPVEPSSVEPSPVADIPTNPATQPQPQSLTPVADPPTIPPQNNAKTTPIQQSSLTQQQTTRQPQQDAQQPQIPAKDEGLSKEQMVEKTLAAIRLATELGIHLDPENPDSRLNNALEGMTTYEIGWALEELQRGGDIYQPRPGIWRVVGGEE